MNKMIEEMDILEYLEQHEHKELLRFITCGSVDDGKSTLIGRLLHDSKLIYEDQLNAVKRDSEKVGTTGAGEIDLALLVDGLQAEREQGITIDVAYRYFSTDKRKFIIADTPGHEQYTRNMATGASSANLAILMIDARHGVLAQTKRHSFLVSLLGLKHVVVAINKMDLVEFSEARYKQIIDDYNRFAAPLHLKNVVFIPVSALKGDNIVDASNNMPWYTGPTLLHHLETVNIVDDRNFTDVRFPIQYVNRPNLNFRGYCGTLASGVLRKGDEIIAIPSNVRTRVKDIVTFEGSIEEATPPLSVTVITETEIDISRGEMIATPASLPQVGRELQAVVIWMTNEPLQPERPYFIKQSTNVVSAKVAQIHYSVDVNTLEKHAAEKLELNQIGRVHLSLSRAIPFDAYAKNQTTGSFIIIDRLSNVTIGAGIIVNGQENIPNRPFWEEAVQAITKTQKTERVSLEERETQFQQKARTIVLSGLPGSGRTNAAVELERRLFETGKAVYLLEDSATPDLQGQNAALLNRAGLIVIIDSPFPSRTERNQIRKVVSPDHYLEIAFTTNAEASRKRIAQANSPTNETLYNTYEPTKGANLEFNLEEITLEQAVDKILNFLG
ncbi:MAG: sulfate adenylyltransferase subunit CysN [Sumerlaeia bacterium]